MAPTLLIGLDGATFSVLDPYVERGVMPFLGSLTERGTRAGLRSIMPPLTPPAWTSMVTGKRPGGHGVFDFFQREEPDDIHVRFANSQDVRSATVWSLASDAGMRVLSLNFPLMFPAARRRRLRGPRRHDAVAPAPARLPSRRAVRPPQRAARLQAARDARHGARGQGDRRLPRGRAPRLRAAAHRARPALARGRAVPDGRGAGRADRRDVRRRRQAPAPVLAVHRPGLPARRADRRGRPR